MATAAMTAAAAGGWYAHTQMNVDPLVAASLAGGAAASLCGVISVGVAARSFARMKTLHARLETLEKNQQVAMRAMASTPDRLEAATSPIRRRLAKAERALQALTRTQAATDAQAAPASRTDEIAKAMKENAQAPAEAAQTTAQEPEQALALTVQSLVSRYTRNGQPRSAPAAQSNDDVPSAELTKTNAAELEGSSKAAERLATTLLRQALGGNGLQIELTPICRLPNRRVIWHEAMSQLRGGAGLLMPADYLPLAGAAGIMPEHDCHLLRRLAQTMQTLPQSARVFANLHVTSLVDPAPLDELTRLVDADPTLASRVVFEFSQADLHLMAREELRGLNTLAKLGFDLSLDGVEDLRLDWKAMARQGFRFIKTPVHVLAGEHRGADVHPADLSAFLKRFGITLIAEGVDGEGRLVQLTEHDVAYAQGRLFAEASERDPRFANTMTAARAA